MGWSELERAPGKPILADETRGGGPGEERWKLGQWRLVGLLSSSDPTGFSRPRSSCSAVVVMEAVQDGEGNDGTSRVCCWLRRVRLPGNLLVRALLWPRAV